MAPKCGEKIENCNMEKKLKTKEGNLCSEICFFLQPVNLKELKIFRLRSARKKLKTKKFTFFFLHHPVNLFIEVGVLISIHKPMFENFWEANQMEKTST